MKYDRERILNDANVENVLSELGVPMKKMRGKYSILCPGHESRLGHPDSNFGSCILWQNGYFCFACNKYVDLDYALIEWFETLGEDITHEKALELILEYLENKSSYILSDANEEKKAQLKSMPYSQEELKAIGLYNIKQDSCITKISQQNTGNGIERCSFVPTKVNERFVRTAQPIYCATEYDNYNLKALYNENEKLFFDIILENTESAISQCEETMTRLKNNPWIFNIMNQKMDYSLVFQKLAQHKKMLCNIKEKTEKNIYFSQKLQSRKSPLPQCVKQPEKK